MEIIDIQKTLAIPDAPPDGKNRMYLVRGDHGGLNVGLSNYKSGKGTRLLRDVRLTGNRTIYQSVAGVAVQATYTIENFDSFTTYDVSISAGSVSIAGNIITVTSPTSPGNVYLKVNGEYSKLTIKPPAVLPAVVTYPVDGIILGTSFTANASAFATSGPADTCASTDWQISPDPTFATGVIASSAAGQSTSAMFSGLSYDTTYYLRMRYTGATLGVADWSPMARAVVGLKPVGGNEVGLIAPRSPVASEGFGNALVLSSDMKNLIVASKFGAGSDGNAGRFSRFSKDSSWGFQQTFTANAATSTEGIGGSLSMCDDDFWIAAGAPGNASKGVNAGAVHLFKMTDGVVAYNTTIYGSTAVAGDLFGQSIAMDAGGNRLIVGAPGTAGSTGVVYIFSRSGDSWVEEAKLSPVAAAIGDLVGTSVSFDASGSLAAIGAPKSSSTAKHTGEVYIYTRTGTVWTNTQNIHVPEHTDTSLFGTEVAVSPTGGEITAYAKGYGIGGTVHVFARNNNEWELSKTLLPSDVSAGQEFGKVIRYSRQESRLVIGAPGDGGFGAVYVFEKSAGAWNQKTKCLPSTRTLNERFGDGVVVSSDELMVFVGATGSSKTASKAGQVYRFI